jgi:hypothetical protein
MFKVGQVVEVYSYHGKEYLGYGTILSIPDRADRISEGFHEQCYEISTTNVDTSGVINHEAYWTQSCLKQHPKFKYSVGQAVKVYSYDHTKYFGETFVTEQVLDEHGIWYKYKVDESKLDLTDMHDDGDTWAEDCLESIVMSEEIISDVEDSDVEPSKYTIKVYVMHGYFEYSVSEMSSALEHAHLIMDSGVYRRSSEDSAVEFHKVIKVKVEGEGLVSEYTDKFVRT